MTVINMCAPNDVNGNPRRLFVVLDEEGVQWIIDEGYAGDGGLKHWAEQTGHRIGYPVRINVTASEYVSWRKEQAAIARKVSV